jgi:hypothetical protein
MDEEIDKIVKLAQKNYDETLEMSEDLGKNYLGYITGTIRELRSFLRDLAFIAGGIIAAVTIFTQEINSKILFYTGIIILLGVIYIVIKYISDVLSDEINELSDQLKGYQCLLDEQIKIHKDYLLEGCFTKESFRLYLDKLNNFTLHLKDGLSDIKKIGNHKKDVILSFLTFLLTLGISFVIISIVVIEIPILVVLAVVFIMTFFMSFFFPIRNFMEFIARPFIWFEEKSKNKKKIR